MQLFAVTQLHRPTVSLNSAQSVFVAIKLLMSLTIGAAISHQCHVPGDVTVRPSLPQKINDSQTARSRLNAIHSFHVSNTSRRTAG